MIVFPKSSSLLGRFFLAALFWLPVWFTIWYYAAPVVGSPVVWLAHWVLDLSIPGIISEVLGYGKDLHFATTIPAASPSSTPAGTIAEIVIPVNLLKYSWNLPVLMALLFAADERFFSLGRMVLGYLALLPSQAWGVVFEILKILFIQLGTETAGRIDIPPWGREAVALGYQFGYLMLPVISASSIWIVLNRSLINALLSAGRELSDKPV